MGSTKTKNFGGFQAHNQSGNRSSFLGTLKGGLGIMGNLSNQDEAELEQTKEIIFNQGKILNIENVLNQLNQDRENTTQLQAYFNSSGN